MDIIIPFILIFLTIYLLGKHDYSTMPYKTYLQSPHWRKTRQKVLTRDKHQCTECHSKTHLNVHHKTYKHLGHERLYELETLCSKCHGHKPERR